MADKEKIRKFIRKLSAQKNNVVVADIEWVMGQLSSFGTVSAKGNVHQRLYTFNGRRFGICTHNPGGKQMKACYVEEFLSAMADTGWYEE